MAGVWDSCVGYICVTVGELNSDMVFCGISLLVGV